MKRLLLILYAFSLSLIVSSQTNTYINEEPYFEFKYPNSFSKDKIVSSPHMVLKLKDDNGIISNCTLSIWNFGLSDRDVDLWNEDLFNMFASNVKTSNPNKDVDIKRTKVKINGSEIKTIETNILNQLNIPGEKKSRTLYIVIHQMLYKGCMLEICFSSWHDFNKSLKFRSEMLKGLTLFD